MSDTAAIDTDVRLHIYEAFLADGVPPSVSDTARALHCSPEVATAAYERLSAARVIVLNRGTNDILMAAPLSAVPTRFHVRVDGRRAYYANCVWDALGILAMLGRDGVVAATCADCASRKSSTRIRSSRRGYMWRRPITTYWWTRTA